MTIVKQELVLITHNDSLNNDQFELAKRVWDPRKESTTDYNNIDYVIELHSYGCYLLVRFYSYCRLPTVSDDRLTAIE